MPELASLAAPALAGLGAIGLLALLGWLASLRRRDVSGADSLWPVLVVTPGLLSAAWLDETGPRAGVVLALALLWALRLAGHITRRHRGQPEDRRYRAIRARNQPNFELKSLWLVFGLQGLLAWVVSAPLVAAVASPAGWQPWDAAGLGLVVLGLGFEAVGDAQLAAFKADPASRGRVLDSGLWRYTRHPNYFGECCLWWGFFLLALPGGGWWSVVSPLLMTLLLLRVSGVTLLEQDIGERRPAYRDYIARTNAFFPGRPR